jgi:DNA-binding MarR family transcriptional regulator
MRPKKVSLQKSPGKKLFHVLIERSDFMRNSVGQHMPTEQDIKKMAQNVAAVDASSVMSMFKILEAGNIIQQKIMDPLERDYDLSGSKMSILMMLYNNDNHPLSPSLMAEKLHVSRANISAMLKRMERNELIEIRTQVADARNKEVYLVNKGKELLNSILPAHYQRIHQLMEPLNEQDRNKLMVLLDLIN